MNNITTRLVMVGIFGVCVAAWGQGSLTPPGAPAPTMKTLDQVEPRTPISGAVTIAQPGSYYLATNSNGKITIQADNVTLDLMGFCLAVSTGDAIEVASGYGTNIVIRNGTLRPGSGAVALDARYADDSRFEDLRIEGNNAWCGIYVGDRCVVRNCDVRGCNNRGISVGDETEVRDCRVIGGTLDGICAGSNCRIVGNVITGHGDDGLYISGTGSYVADNIVKGNADNYDIAPGNQLNILLCEIPEMIEWPCSVKLAGTLTCTQTGTNGITVAADDVTIDLAGHTLVGPGADSGHGIYQDTSYRNLRVFNGKAVNWRGNGNAGIYADGKSAILSDLQVSSNYYGIFAGYDSTLSDCTASYNDYDGIQAGYSSTLSDCAAYSNGWNGIAAGYGSALSGCTAYNNGRQGIRTGAGCTLSGCTAHNNGQEGFFVGYRCTLFGCTAYGNGFDGIWIGGGSTLSGCAASHNVDEGICAGDGSTLSGCAADYNTADGIEVSADARVVGCVCRGNGNGGDGAGIRVTGSGNRIEGNNCTDNDRGIDVDASGNFIVKNTCSGNTTNYDIVAGNAVGTITNTPVGAGPWDNFDL